MVLVEDGLPPVVFALWMPLIEYTLTVIRRLGMSLLEHSLTMLAVRMLVPLPEDALAVGV